MSIRATRIGHVATVVAGGTPTRGVAAYYRGSIPWIKTLDLNCGTVVASEECITTEGLRSIRAGVNPPGSVMVAMYGGAGTIGKSGLLGIEAATNQAVASILPNPAIFDSEFLHYQLMHLRGEWMQFSQGNRKDPNINKSVVEDMLIWLPEDTDVQRGIAASLKAQLAEVDRARQAVTAQRNGAESLLAAIYREAFAQVVPVAVPPTFDDPPAGWQWRKLTDVARLESGHTPSRSRPDWWGGDVSWISLTEIRALDGHWVENTRLRTNAAGIANSAARILPRGTVCYSRTASVGFVAIMAKPMATSQDFANWVCGNSLDPEFLMHALVRARKGLRDLATGATHKTIYMPTLESFHVCAPDIDTQRRIVRSLKQHLEEASALCTALDAQQAELARLPQRLLAQAFEN
ncbi:MAG: restriction endonuclease subunit S [Burkholderiales bacterium]|nr:restriction endonuclease subunit S [Burkholderiales bacterium]